MATARPCVWTPNRSTMAQSLKRCLPFARESVTVAYVPARRRDYDRFDALCGTIGDRPGDCDDPRHDRCPAEAGCSGEPGRTERPRCRAAAERRHYAVSKTH